MNLRQKFLLASKSPSVDILFDDVLTHIKYLVAVVEEVIHFIILPEEDIDFDRARRY